MDSITQVALGAAVGEAILGKKIGYRAAAWGAVLGTFPDLDILANPVLDAVQQLRFHRSITHSVFFSILASPLFGILLNKINHSLEVGWKQWAKMSFGVFFTHILIDFPTTYGTQLLFPFTDTPYTLDSIFIIDPLFTLPLLTGLLTAFFFQRNSLLRKALNYSGLTLAFFYMTWGLGIKPHVHSVFSSSFEHKYSGYEAIKTSPNGPTTFLWNGYILKNDTIYHSVYSLFDENKKLTFQAIPRQSKLIEPYIDDRAVNTILWFSGEFYRAEKISDTLYLYDLRFGRDDFWVTESGNLVWKYEVEIDENNKAVNFSQHLPSLDVRTGNLNRFWNRIW